MYQKSQSEASLENILNTGDLSKVLSLLKGHTDEEKPPKIVPQTSSTGLTSLSQEELETYSRIDILLQNMRGTPAKQSPSPMLSYQQSPTDSYQNTKYPQYGSTLQGYLHPQQSIDYQRQPSLPIQSQLPSNRQQYQVPQLQQRPPTRPPITHPRLATQYQQSQDKYTFNGVQPLPRVQTATKTTESLSQEEVAAYLRVQALMKKFSRK